MTSYDESTTLGKEIDMYARDNGKTDSIQRNKKDYKYIVAIGTSTGGPKALNTIITALSKDLPATYVIVQHMPEGFTKSLANRLDHLSMVDVKEAENGDVLQQGTVYIAPGGKQLKIVNTHHPQISITGEPAYKGHKPSVNVMYQSLADTNPSKKIVAIIMTGMGTDGLEGGSILKDKVKATIIAQNEETCIVYGMPKAIVNAGLADYVVPIDKIVQIIEKIMGE